MAYITDSWDVINNACSDGTAASLYALGDRKTITVNLGGEAESIDLELIGINHDDLADGSGKATLSFFCKQVLASPMQMASTNVNTGGWAGNYSLRQWCNNTLFNALPDDLRAVIQPVKKLSNGGQGSSELIETQDRVWLGSVEEFCNLYDAYDTLSGQGTRYAYTKSPIDETTDGWRTKKAADGSAKNWWLRSSTTSTYKWNFMTTSGGVSIDNATNDMHVAFGVCIGKEGGNSDGSDVAYKIQGKTLTAIADAIRAKTGATTKLTPEQMASVIESVNLALQAKTVTPTTEAQEVTPDSGYYGLSKVTVEAAEAAGLSYYIAMESKAAYCDKSTPSATGAAQLYPTWCSCQIQGSNNSVYRTFLQYDLSGLPEGANIVRAILRVKDIEHNDNGANGTTNIARVTTDWDETTVSWNNQPAFIGQYLAESVSPPGVGAWSDWDITDLVREWVDGVYPNYGLHIVNNNEGEYRVNWRISNRLRGSTEEEMQTHSTKIDILYTTSELALDDLAITEHPQSVSCSNGATVTLSVRASGTAIRYQWQYMDVGATVWSEAPGLSKMIPDFTFTAATAQTGRQFRCVVTDFAGNSVASNTATVTVT